MAGVGVNFKVNLDELDRLSKKITDITNQLSKMDGTKNVKAFNALNKELKATTQQYNALQANTIKQIQVQNALNSSVNNTSGSLVGLAKKGLALAGISFGADKMVELGKAVVNVFGQMQQLETAFKTMLQSGEKATALMNDLKQFTLTTPFQLLDSATAAKQLLAYGTASKDVIKDLRMLGDVAAGLSQPIGEIVYLYGTLQTQGRAYAMDIRQFASRGIPIYAELAKVLKINVDQVNEFVSAGKVGFAEVQQAFRNMTSDGGMYAGMMAEQSKTVLGKYSNLQDKLQFAAAEIGRSNEGLISGSIDVASKLVENYQTIGEILVSLVATYGLYKAALIASEISITGVTTAEKALSLVLLAKDKIQKSSLATLAANPYALAAAAVVALSYGVYKLATANTAAEIAQNALNKSLEDGAKFKQDLEQKTNALVAIINNDTRTTFDQLEAYRELQALYPDILGNIDLFTFKSKSATDQQKELNAAISEQGKQKQEASLEERIQLLNQLVAAQERYQKAASFESSESTEKARREFNALQNKIADILDMGFWEQLGASNQKYVDALKLTIDDLENQKKKQQEIEEQAKLMAMPEKDRIVYLNDQLSKLKEQESIVRNQISAVGGLNNEWSKFNPLLIDLNGQLSVILSKIQKTTADIGETKGFGNLQDQIKATKDKLAELRKEYKEVRGKTGIDIAKGLEEKGKEIKETEDKLSMLLYGTTAKDQTRTENKAQKAADIKAEAERNLNNLLDELGNDKVKNALALEQKLLDIRQDGFDKQLAQNALNYKKELLDIDEFKTKAIEKQQEAAKLIYQKETGKKTGFDFSKFDVKKLPKELQPDFIEQYTKDLTEAAAKGFDFANTLVAKDLTLQISTEKLKLGDELSRQLAEIDTFYNEEIKKAKISQDEIRKNEKLSIQERERYVAQSNQLIAQFNENRDKEILTAKQDFNEKSMQLEFDLLEKELEISDKRYVFQSDKDAELLRLKIANNEKYIATLKERFKIQTGVEFDTLDQDGLNEIAKKYPQLVASIKKAQLEQKGFNNELKKTPAQKLQEVSGLISSISSTLGQITGMDFSMLNDVFGGIVSLASGNVLGAIGSGVSLIGNIFNSILGNSEERIRVQKELNRLQREYNDTLIENKYNIKDTVDYTEIYKDNIELINNLIKQGIINVENLSIWESLNKDYKEASDNVKQYSNELSVLQDKVDTELNLLERYTVNPEALKVLRDYYNSERTIADQIYALQQYNLLVELKGGRALREQWIEDLGNLNEKTKEWNDKLLEVRNQLASMAVGTDFSGFLDGALDAITEWIKNGKQQINGFANFTNETLKKAILSSFKYVYLQKALQPMFDRLTDLMLSSDGKPAKEALDEWAKDFNKTLTDTGNNLDYILESLGVSLDDLGKTGQQAARGGFETMSQDVATELNGRFTAIQMNTEQIKNDLRLIAGNKSVDVSDTLITISDAVKAQTIAMNDMSEIQRNCFYELRDINQNTKELYAIKDALTAIKSNTSRI